MAWLQRLIYNVLGMRHRRKHWKLTPRANFGSPTIKTPPWTAKYLSLPSLTVKKSGKGEAHDSLSEAKADTDTHKKGRYLTHVAKQQGLEGRLCLHCQEAQREPVSVFNTPESKNDDAACYRNT